MIYSCLINLSSQVSSSMTHQIFEMSNKRYYIDDIAIELPFPPPCEELVSLHVVTV